MDFFNQYISSLFQLVQEIGIYMLFGFFLAGILSVSTSVRKFQNSLNQSSFSNIIKASIMGVPLPLCSCGVLPVATSFKRNGVSNSSTISFLISTPQTGIDSIAATFGILGPFLAIFRPIAALVSGVIGGIAIYFLGDDEERLMHVANEENSQTQNSIKSLFNYAFIDLPQDIVKPFVIGLLLASIIEVFIPQSNLMPITTNDFISYIAIILISIPLYVCATASLPIALVLLGKGFSVGSVILFLIVGPATNTTALITVFNLFRRKNAIIYLGTVVLTGVFSALLLDRVLSFEFDLVLSNGHVHSHAMMFPDSIEMISGIILIIVFANAYRHLYKMKKIKTTDDKFTTLNVSGMTCAGCMKNVKQVIENYNFVNDVRIILETGDVYIYGDSLNLNQIKTSIIKAGYGVND